jgi:hypothetical protein
MFLSEVVNKMMQLTLKRVTITCSCQRFVYGAQIKTSRWVLAIFDWLEPNWWHATE